MEHEILSASRASLWKSVDKYLTVRETSEKQSISHRLETTLFSHVNMGRSRKMSSHAETTYDYSGAIQWKRTVAHPPLRSLRRILVASDRESIDQERQGKFLHGVHVLGLSPVEGKCRGKRGDRCDYATHDFRLLQTVSSRSTRRGE
ncbi:PREDICTED: uncharacterized protein LOC105566652 [Vollenhovia emeryi]|uniref:uncharacterized protein LOC105566652 n=1 Tax=Vollenhovia emeryi TaxID=411798 RepID=UPI0005F41991|nr:PREDICTED: uncharacterized protein LOC105566652 [Vollenhovia emeryi]